MAIESKSPLRKWGLQRVVKWEGLGCRKGTSREQRAHSWRLSARAQQRPDSQRPGVHLGTRLSLGAESAPKPRPLGSRLFPPGHRCMLPPWLTCFSGTSCVRLPVGSVLTFAGCAPRSFLFPERLPLPATKGFPSFREGGSEAPACCSVVGARQVIPEGLLCASVLPVLTRQCRAWP